MPSGYMYILRCSDGSYYTGSTKNLVKRLTEHQNGEGTDFTKNRLPVDLVYFENFQRIEMALRREKQIQCWSHLEIEALLRHDQLTFQELVEDPREMHWF